MLIQSQEQNINPVLHFDLLYINTVCIKRPHLQGALMFRVKGGIKVSRCDKMQVCVNVKGFDVISSAALE